MRNETKRAALLTLANAPNIAAAELLKRLTTEERAEALRLFKALGVKPQTIDQATTTE